MFFHRVRNFIQWNTLDDLAVISYNKMCAGRSFSCCCQIFKIAAVLLCACPFIGGVMYEYVIYICQRLSRSGIRVRRQKNFFYFRLGHLIYILYHSHSHFREDSLSFSLHMGKNIAAYFKKSNSKQYNQCNSDCCHNSSHQHHPSSPTLSALHASLSLAGLIFTEHFNMLCPYNPFFPVFQWPLSDSSSYRNRLRIHCSSFFSYRPCPLFTGFEFPVFHKLLVPSLISGKVHHIGIFLPSCISFLFVRDEISILLYSFHSAFVLS